MSRYLLIPVDDSGGQSKEIMIAEGLVDDSSYKDLYNHVSDEKKLKTLLNKLSNIGLVQDRLGFVKHKDTVLEGVKFRDAVIDSCNGRFLDCYEPFYELIRKFGIVF